MFNKDFENGPHKKKKKKWKKWERGRKSSCVARAKMRMLVLSAQGLPILETAQHPKELNSSMTLDLLSRPQRSLGLCYSAEEKKVAAHGPPSMFTHPSSLLSLSGTRVWVSLSKDCLQPAGFYFAEAYRAQVPQIFTSAKTSPLPMISDSPITNTTLQQRIGTVTLHFSIRKKEIQKYFKNYACKEFHLSFLIKINLKF